MYQTNIFRYTSYTLLGMLILIGPSFEVCPADYVQYEDRCLSLGEDPVTWQVANDTCLGVGARVSQPDHPGLSIFVTSLIRRKGNLIIGAVRVSSTEFEWIEGETSKADGNWALSMPSQTLSKDGLYIDINGYWTDTSHSTGTWYYLCETLLTVPDGDIPQRWFSKENYKIDSAVDKTLTSVTLTTCLASCQVTTDFTCLSVEYNAGSCELKSTNQNSPGVILTPSSGWDHFELYSDACSSHLMDILNVSYSASKTTSSWTPPEAAYLYTRYFVGSPTYGYFRTNNNMQWLQIDFGERVRITSVATLGGGWQMNAYTLSYYLLYGPDGQTWTYYTSPSGSPKNFIGNWNKDILHGTILGSPIITRYILININKGTAYVLRFGAFGCVTSMPETEAGFSDYPVGMETGEIMDSQLEASSVYSFQSKSAVAFMARPHYAGMLGRLYGYWRPATNNPGEWIQADLIIPHYIRSIGIQGAEIYFVTTFKVQYSDDLLTWETATDQDNNDIIFQGCFDSTTMVLSVVNITSTRFVRILPQTHYGLMQMHFEIYGYPTQCPNVCEDIMCNATSGGGCSCSNSVPSLCHVEPTVHISMELMYLLTGITFQEPNDNATDILPQFTISSDHGESWLQLNASEIVYVRLSVDGSTEEKYIFKRIQRATDIQISTDVTSTFCKQISIMGCLAPECPPGFVRFKKNCYMTERLTITPAIDKERAICSRNRWKKTATFVTIYDIDENAFVRMHAHRSGAFVWLGVKPNTSVTPYEWHWEDGREMPWTLWSTPSIDGDYQCALLYPKNANNLKWKFYICNVYSNYMCKTPANVLKDVREYLWKSYRHSDISTPGYGGATYVHVSESWCLQKCLQNATNACPAVAYNYYTRTCQLKLTNSTDALVTFAYGSINFVDFFEPYLTDCDEALVWCEDCLQEKAVSGSTIDQSQSHPREAYLDNRDDFTVQEYLTIDLKRWRTIRRISTQGSGTINCYVKSFYLWYSNNSLHWHVYRDNNGKYQNFQANSERENMVFNVLDKPITARFIRIYASSYVTYRCIRFEIYGCGYNCQAYKDDFLPGCGVEVRGWSPNDRVTGEIYLNGVRSDFNVLTLGMRIVILNVTDTGCSISDFQDFNVASRQADALALASYVDSIPNGTVFLGASAYDVAAYMSHAANSFTSSGIYFDDIIRYEAISFVAMKDNPEFLSLQRAPDQYGIAHIVREIIPFVSGIYKEVNYAALGMESGVISASQLDVSGYTSTLSTYHEGRLFSGYSHQKAGGMVAIAQHANQWYRVNFGRNYTITGLIIQGGPRDACVSDFKVDSGYDDDIYLEHKTSDGNIKSYSACANGEVVVPQYVMFDPVITAKFLRIRPTELTCTLRTCRYRLEFLGYLKDPDIIEVNVDNVTVSSGPDAGSCDPEEAINPQLCPGWCIGHGDTWWRVDLLRWYEVHAVHVISSTVNILDVRHVDVLYSKDGVLWNTTIIESYPQVLNDSTMLAIHFVPRLILNTLKILLHNITQETCITLRLFGYEAKECPPGAALRGDLCYYSSWESVFTYIYANRVCRGLTYLQPGRIAVAKTTETAHFLHNLRFQYGIIGLHKDGDQWMWSDGENAAFIPWKPDSSTTTYPCATLNLGYVEVTRCESTYFLTCETEAAINSISSRVFWFHRHNFRISHSDILTPTSMTITECMSLCLETAFCKSIAVKADTCKISTKNLQDEYESLSDGFNYYEHHLLENTCFLPMYKTYPALTTYDAWAYNPNWAINYLPLDYQYTNSGVKAWLSGKDPVAAWVEMRFEQYAVIYGVTTHGAGLLEYTVWTTTYYVAFSLEDSGEWALVKGHNGGMALEFQGNQNFYSRATNIFPEPIVTKRLRLILRESSSVHYFGMRMDLYGCLQNQSHSEIPTFPLMGKPLGMESYYIMDSQLKSSGYFWDANGFCPPKAARYNLKAIAGGSAGWIAYARYVARQQWYQIDFIHINTVYGFKIMGDYKGYPKSLKLASSNTSCDWTWLSREDGQPQELAGAIDHTNGYYQYIQPAVVCRFIRLYPISFQTHNTLKIEPFGYVNECPEISSNMLNISLTSDVAEISECANIGQINYQATGSLEPCAMFCPSTQESTSFIEIDLLIPHHVSGIKLADTLSSLASVTLTIQYKMNFTNWTDVDETNTRSFIERNNSFLHLSVGRPLKAEHLRLTLSPSNELLTDQNCYALRIHGCPFTVCPPGFAPYLGKCYHVDHIGAIYEDGQKWCRVYGDSWVGGGRLVEPRDPETLTFISSIYRKMYLLPYIGVRFHSADGTWKWESGSPADYLAWKSGHPLAPKHLVVLDYMWPQSYSTSNNYLRPYICEVSPASDEVDNLEWLSINNYRGTAVDSFEMANVNATECLFECYHGDRLEGCGSVTHHQISQTCWLHRSNRYFADITMTTEVDYIYFEIYRRGKCETRLISSASQNAGVTFEASSTLSGFSADDVLYNTPIASRMSYWRPAINDVNQWHQVTFLQVIKFNRILIGSQSDPVGTVAALTLKITVTTDNINWKALTDHNNQQIFRGPDHPASSIIHQFPANPSARIVRFSPVSWLAEGIGLSYEIYGCFDTVTLSCLTHEFPEVFLTESPSPLYCQESWNLLLYRANSSFSFPSDLTDYINGLGTNETDYWIGNKMLAYLTRQDAFTLRVNIWGSDGNFYDAEFSGVSILDASKGFALVVSSFLGGTAGDGGMLEYTDLPMTAFIADGTAANCTGYAQPGWYLPLDKGCLTSNIFGVPGTEGLGGLSWATLGTTIDKMEIWGRPSSIEIVNVAEKKPTLSSSTTGGYISSYAVDGIINKYLAEGSCFQAGDQQSPWFRVDLIKSYRIISVLAISRVDCCPEQLQNVSVQVGTELSSDSYSLCGEHPGVSTPGDMVTITCSSPLDGQYILLSVPAPQLTLCELQVFSTDPSSSGPRGLDDNCLWNSDCAVEFSDCRPGLGSDMICMCKQHYDEINGKCIPVCDVVPTHLSVTTSAVSIVRNTPTSVDMHLNLTNVKGVPLPRAENATNYHIIVFVSDSPDGDGVQAGSEYLTDALFEHFNDSAIDIGESLEFLLKFDVSVSADMCHFVQYICVNVTPGVSAAYREMNQSNNIQCESFSSLLTCQPGLDIVADSVTFPDPKPILRSVIGEYTYDITLTLPVADYPVIGLSNDFVNYNVSYCYSAAPIASIDDFLNMEHSQSNMDFASGQAGLSAAGTHHLIVTATQGMNFDECDTTTLICFLVLDAEYSSYSETDAANNIVCYDVSTDKSCTPNINVHVTEFTFSNAFKFIRGYADKMQFSVQIQNTDPLLPVIRVNAPAENFNVTALYSSERLDTHRQRRSSVILSDEYVSALDGTSSTDGLEVGETLNLTGNIDVKIPRDICSDVVYLCVKVNAAEDASYTLAGGTSHIFCSDISTNKLCQGVAIEGLFITTATPTAAEQEPIFFTVGWTIGTDVEYLVDFGDNSTYSWVWSEQGHTETYRDLNTTLNHTYTSYDNRTITVSISNQIGSDQSELDVFIEPELEARVNISSEYVPRPIPSLVQFIVQMLEAGPLICMYCEFEFDDPLNSQYPDITLYVEVTVSETFTHQHVYRTDRSDSLAKVTCRNTVSILVFTQVIKLREDIIGLLAESVNPGWLTNEMAYIQLSVANGSHVEFDVDFGDGQDKHFIHPQIFSYASPYIITHNYTSNDNFTLSVFAFNKYFNMTSDTVVIVQYEVRELSITGPENIPLPPGTAKYSITSDPAVPFPSNVFCDWYINNKFRETVYAHQISLGQIYEYDLLFQSSDVGGAVPVNVSCKNLASEQMLTHVLIVYEVIEGLQVRGATPGAEPQHLWTLVMTVTNGSDVTFSVDYGDGTPVQSYKHHTLLAASLPFTATKMYSRTGNFTVTVNASNPVSDRSTVLDPDFAVQNPIQDLNLSANVSVVWPPGVITFYIISGAGQQDLSDVHCDWNFNGIPLKYTYIENFDAGEQLQEEWTTDRRFLGHQETLVNCSNLVSSQVIAAPTYVILDAIILGNFTTNGSVLWTNETVFMLNISRFGTGSCFRWDMGDGSVGVLHGVAECEIHKNGRPFIEIQPNTMDIIFGYTYETFNTFTVTVFAFNYVSNDTIKTEAVVYDWPCQTPNATISENFTDASNPWVQMKSQAFTIEADYEVDCMKTTYVYAVWEVYKSDNLEGVPVMVQEDNLNFEYSPRDLIYGNYVIRLNATMVDVENTSRLEYVYLSIVKTPLHVEIGGGDWVDYMFKATHLINGKDFSYDPDEDPQHWTEGLAYTWYCYQNRTSDTFKKAFDNETYVQMVETSTGCFSDTGGQLEYTSGSFMINTYFMYPMVYYSMSVEVSKDTRIGRFDQVIFIAGIEPPVIHLLCRENCADRKLFTRRIVMKANCLKNCKSKFGQIQHNWVLKTRQYPSSDAWEEITDLDQYTDGGIHLPSIFFPETLLKGGMEYQLTVEAWVPGSLRGRNVTEFHINLPPFGGNCQVSPKIGRASSTLFSISCDRWEEWIKMPGANLRYDYRIRQKGSPRSFQVFFGTEVVSDPVVFPVGDIYDNFTLEVVVLIVDSIKDFYLMVDVVQVYPKDEEASSVIDNILAKTSGDNNILKQLYDAGLIQKMAATAFAITSELNVPSSLYRTPACIETQNNTVNSTDNANITDHSTTPPVEINSTYSSNNSNLLTPDVFCSFPDVTSNKIKARTNVVREVVKIVADSTGSLSQNNEILRSLMAIPEEVELIALDMSAAHLGNLTNVFVEFKKEGEVVNVKMMATDLISTSIKVMIPASLISDQDKQVQMEKNETQGNETSETQEKVGNVMENVVDVINIISAQLVEDKEPLDPSDRIEFPEITVVASKINSYNLGQASFTSTQGSIIMPDPKDVFGDQEVDCVSSKMFFSFINPFIYGNETTVPVNSSVLQIVMEDCSIDANDSAQSSPLPISNGTLPVPYEMSLVPETIPPPSLVYNITPTNQDRLLFHTFNVTDPPSTVQFNLYPGHENETFEIFIEIDRQPSPQNYKWQYSIPRNFTELSIPTDMNEDEITEMMFTIILPAANLSSGMLYFGVRPYDPDECVPCMENRTLEYEVRIIAVKCQSWNEQILLWESIDCEVDETTTTKRVKFKSNLFGSLGAGLFVGPNTIDFGTVFLDFDKKLLENIAVVATILAIVLLYIPLAVFSRKRDKADLLKWQCYPLVDNIPSDKYMFELHVYTGTRKEAETTSNISFVLVGTQGDTGIKRLDDGINKNFCRGDANYFSLSTSYDVGDVYCMRIWHDNSGKGSHKSWFLSKIVVVNKTTQKWYIFYCEKWLAADRGDKKVERILRVSNFDSSINTGLLLKSNISRRLFEDHIWLSVIKRKSRSSFTRVQRLSCCLALLYLTMISNAMWYKDSEDSSSHSSILKIGPFNFTTYEVYASIMSSIIVLPPLVFIIFCFTRSTEKTSGDKYSKFTKTKGQSMDRDVKPKFLPHWFIYVGWVTIFLSVLASSFFTMLYSFQWGKVKSTAWLLTFLFSIFESVLLFQPMMVFIICLILSLVMKKDTVSNEYEQMYGQPTDFWDVQEGIDEFNEMFKEGLSEKEMRRVRQMKDMDAKIGAMLKEVVFQVAYVLVLLCVIYGNQDTTTYLQNSNLVSTYTYIPIGMNLQAPRSLYQWFKAVPVENLYYEKSFNGEETSEYDHKFVSNMYGMRLGPPRIRQLRVVRDRCHIPRVLQRQVSRCALWYDIALPPEDNQQYLPGWKDLKNTTIGPQSELQESFLYRSTSELDGVMTWARLDYLGGGGYVVNLGQSKYHALSILDELETANWIDRYTRAVILEFNLYNANTNLFSLATVIFEYPPSGGMFMWHQIDSVSLYRYNGGAGVFALLFEMACMICFIIRSVQIIKSSIKYKLKYLLQFWTIYRILTLILLAVAMFVYAYRSVWTVKAVTEMMNNRGEIVNFQKVAIPNSIFLIFLGLTTFFVQMEFIYIIRYSKFISIMGVTLAKAGPEMLSMFIGAWIVLLAYASAGNVSYGATLQGYSTIKDAIYTLTSAFLGKYDFVSIQQAGGTAGSLFLISYLVFAVYILMDIFITLLNYFLEAIANDRTKWPKYHVIFEYFVKSVKSFILDSSENYEVGEDTQKQTR